MARVKRGFVARRRHKKILKFAKGYYGSKHKLFKTANEQVMRSFMYAYRDRRQRKRDFRKLWIIRINAAARLNGLSYSKLMHGSGWLESKSTAKCWLIWLLMTAKHSKIWSVSPNKK